MAQSREERLAVKKKYREENKEKIKVSSKLYREKNKEKVLLGKKEYREKNREKIKMDMRLYRKNFVKNHSSKASTLLGSCRRRAKLSGSLMTLTKDWILKKLELGVCDVTGLHFSYERSKEHTRSAFTPSVDRIDPRNPNYTEDNCRVVLWAVNNTFAEYGEEIMLPILEAILNANQKSIASLSNRPNNQSLDDAKLRAILRAGIGEDDNDAYHHCGADARSDIDHRTEKGGGDRLAARDAKMGTLKASFSFQNYGVSCPAVEEFIRNGGHLSDKP